MLGSLYAFKIIIYFVELAPANIFWQEIKNGKRSCLSLFVFVSVESPYHRPSIKVDMAIQAEGAREGQLFGLKI